MNYLTTVVASVVLMVASISHSQMARAETQTIVIDGVIQAPGILRQANEIHALDEDVEKVQLVINSPGGGVYSGLQFINAMRAAKARGVRFSCYVPGMAASMAFQIYLECDERYAYPYSLLLWHPVRVQGLFTLTPADTRYLSWSLREIERRMLPALYSALRMEKREVNWHYVNETMWTAEGLLAASPDFLQVVTDMPFRFRSVWPTNTQGRSGGNVIEWDDFEIGAGTSEIGAGTPEIGAGTSEVLAE